MDKPVLLPLDAKPRRVSLKRLAEIFSTMERNGRCEELTSRGLAENAVVAMPPETVNLIKEIIFETKMFENDPLAKEMMTSNTCDPWFKKQE